MGRYRWGDRHRAILSRMALAMYPAPIRDRYGAEIAELLAGSPTPIRDLVNVAWCALVDRGDSITVAQVQHTLRTTATVAFAPSVRSTGGSMMMFGFAWLLGQPLIAYGLAAGTGANPTEILAVAVYVALGAIIGARFGRSARFSGLVPVALAIIGPGAITLLLHGTMWYATSASFRLPVICACVWALGMVVLLPAVTRIARRARRAHHTHHTHCTHCTHHTYRRITWLVAAFGGLLIADLSLAAAVWLSLPVSETHWSSAAICLPYTLGMKELVLHPGFESPSTWNAICFLSYPLIGVTAFAVGLVVTTTHLVAVDGQADISETMLVDPLPIRG